jgi:2-polyprenyl-3-methyl-5-hydroxy-6-metoxy-1,4-benzoquinol methylase
MNTWHAADEGARDTNEANKSWWEAAAMTYEDWSSEDREPQNKAHFEAINRAYLQQNPFLEDYFPRLELGGMRVLEIGCGMGSAIINLQARGPKTVTAIDLTEKATGLAKANLEHFGVEADVRQMDAEQIAFADNSFDFLYSWGVIHHSQDTDKILDHIARVLVPGGRGLIMVYNRNSLRYYLKGLYQLLFRGLIFKGETFGSVQKYFTDGYFHTHYSGQEFEAILKSKGLRAEKTSLSHMAKRFIPLMPVWIDTILKRKFGWLLVVEFSKP